MIKNLKALFFFSILCSSIYCVQIHNCLFESIHVSGGSTFILSSGGSSVILCNSAISAGQWIIENITAQRLTAGFIGILIIIMYLRFSRNTIINGDNTPIITDAGEVETKVIDIPNINDIIISNIGKLVVSKCDESNQETLVISADKNIMPLLKYERDGNKLHVDIKKNVSFSTRAPIVFSATVKYLNVIEANNHVCAEITSSFTEQLLTLTANNHASITSNKTQMLTSLDLHTTNHSNINAEVIAQDITLHTSNDSVITIAIQTKHLQGKSSNNSILNISGKTQSQKVTLENNTKYYAYYLISDCAEINATNNSSATTNVQQHITYRLSNNSSLTYKGNPQLTGTNKNNSAIRQTR